MAGDQCRQECSRLRTIAESLQRDLSHVINHDVLVNDASPLAVENQMPRESWGASLAFSRKRADKQPYSDYYEKITTYIALITHEAQAIDPACDARSMRPVPAVVEAQKRVFRYPDMATTRAGIGAATAKLLADRIAIVGLGGTGSYILDLVAKTPVEQIHLFDGDDFDLHNAFRSPGAPRIEELTKPKKVHCFADIYDRMRTGIERHPYHVTPERLPEPAGFDFVFVAIDDALIEMKVPFIDVGIDVAFDKDNALRGTRHLRSTAATPSSPARTAPASAPVIATSKIKRRIRFSPLSWPLSPTASTRARALLVRATCSGLEARGFRQCKIQRDERQ